MENIHLNFNINTWHRANSPKGYVRGTAFLNNALLKDADLINLLPGVRLKPAMEKCFFEVEWFFSVVCFGQNGLVAAVDRIRSIPIFYGKAYGLVYLSDNAEWVRQQVGDKEMDPVARDEFQLAGYVTGQDTLFPNVKQLQAGEMLRITLSDNEPQIEPYRYYRFTHKEPSEWDEPALRDELDRVTEASIKRLIKYADGRQIVVPLSGGYDSRLIVTILKRLGYDNILSFTYGVPGNKESIYSQKVANSLGIKWHFVEYSKELWRIAWQTDERWQYQKWASGWCSVAHMQDWLAVKILKADKTINDNCIFAPGHTGDFISGGHLPNVVFNKNSFSAEDLSYLVFQKHYSLLPIGENRKRDEAYWKQKIILLSEMQKIISRCDLAEGLEKWEWQERQSKYIGNSIRVYDFFGYEWWMPLWDAEFMAFWQGVPLILRKRRKWYVRYVQNNFIKFAGDISFTNFKNVSDLSLLQAIKNKLPIVSEFRQTLRPLELIIFGKFRGPKHLAWDARYEYLNLANLYRKGYTPVGINAYDLLLSIDSFLRK